MRKTRKFINFALAVVLLAAVAAFPVEATQHTIKTGVGVVDVAAGSTLRLRSKASTSSTILASAPAGEVVIVEGKVGNWYKVIYNLYEGYMSSDYLNVVSAENVELGYGMVNDTQVNMRSGPGTSYKSLGKFTKGEKAYIIGINNCWYKVIYNDTICYIRSDYLDVTEIPYENRDSAKKPLFFVDGKSTGIAVSAEALNGGTVAPDLPDKEEPVVPDVPASDQAAAIIATAKKYLGVPYKWGGTSPSGFDCSGFTQYVFKAHGITLPRTVASQYALGTKVTKAELIPGDLVFFYARNKDVIGHVGIYIGDNQFIHASSKGIAITSLSSTYYINHYYGCRRILQ